MVEIGKKKSREKKRSTPCISNLPYYSSRQFIIYSWERKDLLCFLPQVPAYGKCTGESQIFFFSDTQTRWDEE